MTVTLHTPFLFDILLWVLQPDLVCDIGSMDGASARRFRRRLPKARIVAFEANPANLRAMCADPRHERAGITIVPKAAWREDRVIPFHVQPVGPHPLDPRRGISSVLTRLGNAPAGTRIEVEATRLDSWVRDLTPRPRSIAIWLDVEGAGYEALSGLEGVRGRVDVVHVEVETRPFWSGQRLARDVEELMNAWGFQLLARGYFEPQHDLVFVRRERLETSGRRIRLAVSAARALSWACGGRLLDRAQRYLWRHRTR